MSQTLTERIDRALQSVMNPRTGKDVLASEMVRDVATTRSGKVRLTLLLDPLDDAVIVRDVRQAVAAVDGVSDVFIDVRDPAQQPKPPAPPPAPAPSRQLPVMDSSSGQSTPRTPPAPTPVAYPNLGKVIAVSSGKGGVGKSTVAVNLAVSLARAGKRVGLMDADVYGPNIPRMMGVSNPLEPAPGSNRILPHEAHGVKLVSLGFLIERDQPAIWRGPIIMKIVTQFLRDVEWGELDYFIVDLPPGTGDAQLSLVQATHVHGAVIVTTPQEVSAGDALRGAMMFIRVNVPVLGIVENMSYFENPETGKPIAVFGSGGGERLAAELEVPVLGHVPLYPPVMSGGDTGTPIVVAEPQSAAARAMASVAEAVAAAISEEAGVAG
jgi:ATP-binding protein involved in chromosome partitioning